MMRKIMINTICKNYLKAHHIFKEDEDITRRLLEQLPDESLKDIEIIIDWLKRIKQEITLIKE